MSDRILLLLKTKGPQTAADLGNELGTTSENARQQLMKLSGEGLVEPESVVRGVGRPSQFWQLTTRGHGRFPDTHAELTVGLLRNIRDLLGADALAAPLFFEAALAMARTLLRSNRLEEAREILERTLPHALEREEFGLAAEIEGTLANYYNWIGDIRQSRAHTLRRQTHAEASGDRFAQRHVQSWLAVRDADVRGIWSPNQAHAESTAALARSLRVGDAKAFTSLAEMVKAPEIDAIWICGPNHKRIENMEEIVAARAAGAAPFRHAAMTSSKRPNGRLPSR